MNIVIVGANFYNKGAQLMLLTVLRDIKQFLPDATVYGSSVVYTPDQLRMLGMQPLGFPLYHVGSRREFPIGLRLGGLLRFVKSEWKTQPHLKDMDVILDISGFAFTDQWGSKPVANVSALLHYAQRNDIQYVFMPQAFGPFTGSAMRAHMRKALQKASLVFARDEISWQHLNGLESGVTIQRAPDITLTLHPETSGDIQSATSTTYCAIVPNIRMVDQGAGQWKAHYVKVLQQVVATVLDTSQHDVRIIVHDASGQDRTIADQLLKVPPAHTSRIQLVTEEDPMKLKAVLAQAHMVVGSRFHALASALSSNVPSIALGWSHKYRALFDEYGVSELAFLEYSPTILEQLAGLLDGNRRNSCATILEQHNQTIATQHQEMWQTIQTVLT